MSFPTFTAFSTALHGGREPFPWQARLAENVLATGWPELLDLPTGVGKTTSLEIALYALAAQPAKMSRRMVLVVDRRVVVDQGADEARFMLSGLTKAKDGPLKIVADALRALWGARQDEPPFAVAVMRGGMPRDNDWAKRPDQPVVGVSTVDQVGSRLLFRGYGIGAKSASIHAGLIGNDTLILLDEVHLSVPFAQTLEKVQKYKAASTMLPERFHVVQMSATPGAGARAPFQLGPADHNHPVLKQRLEASKRATLQAVKVTGDDEGAKRAVIAAHVVKEALALQSQGAVVVGVVVNRVDTARLAAQLLAKVTSTTSVLVTGRMRALDRDRVVKDMLVPGAGARRTRATAANLIVIATQCIEAGADLDFDALVTECASLDALRQRFGRVDRRGERGSSDSVIVCRSDQTSANDPVYGMALSKTWQWLQTIVIDGAVDFGIKALPAPSEDERASLLADPKFSPVMLPAHVDSWVQTAPKPTTDPDVALWLHGPERIDADVQVIWRADLDLTNLDRSVARLTATRPSSLESITLPIAAVRRWFQQQPAWEMADTVLNRVDEDDWRRNRRESGPVALRWDGDDSEVVDASSLRPGAVLIVAADRGGIGADSFDPDAKTLVIDLGDLAQLRGRGRASLRLTASALAVWALPADVLAATPRYDAEQAPVERRAQLDEWLDRWPEHRPTAALCTNEEYAALLKTLRHKRRRDRLVGDQLLIEAEVPSALKTSLPLDLVEEAVTEDDNSSFLSVEVTLQMHSDDVRTFARDFTRHLHLPQAIADDVVLAAWFHDVGKADARFQRWLVGGSEIAASMLDEPLAKSAIPGQSAAERAKAQRLAGYPRGYRHELLSMNMIDNKEALKAAHDRDLVLHLVASHHGWCRPFAPPVDHPDAIKVHLNHEGQSLEGDTHHRLSRLDSGVADRFWSLTERYGWWGLAWLEAIMRLADHRASALRVGDGE